MARVENYTTTIAATKTAGEIVAMLAEHGATRIAIDYQAGNPTGLTFQTATAAGDRVFTLPVDVAAMHRLLRRESAAGRLRGLSRTAADDPEQAQRVAWRVIKEWVAAQMTIVAADMASLDQVMLPYLQVEPGRTVFDVYQAQRSLPAGSAS